MRALDRYNLLLALLLAPLLWLQQQPLMQPPPLLDIDVSKVSEIRVLKNNRLQLSFLRDAQGWMLTHPGVERADGQRTASLLSLAKAPSLWRTQVNQENLQIYGLDSPQLGISFDQHLVRFGIASTPAGQRYVLVDDQIHLIDDSYFRIASLPFSHFLEKR